MAITIEVNGIQYDGFTDAEIEITLDTISGRFQATSTTLTQVISPFSVGQECVVRVDDEEVITGYIEQINVTYDAESHDIVISGRDKTADVIDSSTPEKNEFQSDLSLQGIIEKTLSNAGIADIGVIDKVGDLTNFTTGDISSSDTGETIFEFLRALAEKKQVFLTTDGQGNIVISRSSGEGDIENLISDPLNTSSNILSGLVVYESQDRFNNVQVKSQSNNSGAVSLESFISGNNSVNVSGNASDSDIRSSRKLTILSNKTYNTSQLNDRAAWEVNIRRISSKRYSCLVQGHTRPDKSGIWRPNQLVKIKDVFCDLDAIMLINTVKFSIALGDGQGERTELTFVDKDAYKIEAEKSKSETKSNNVGFELFQ